MPAASPASATSRCARGSAASCSSANSRRARGSRRARSCSGSTRPPTRSPWTGREAQLQQAQATLRQAEENFNRIEELFRRGVSTDVQLDEARSQRDQARASVSLAEAEIEGAKLNLGYTTVTAPAAGVTALQSPPIGTLIQAQQTLLTTITQLDPAYVNFSFTDRAGPGLPGAQRAAREADHREGSDGRAALCARRRSIPQRGRIDTAAQRVDPQTGTIQARAIFPNPDGVLLPGQFVRVRDPRHHASGRHRHPAPGGEPGTARALGLRRRRERCRPGPADPPRPRGRGGLGRAGGTERRRAGRRRRRDPRPPGTARQAGAALRRTQARTGPKPPG